MEREIQYLKQELQQLKEQQKALPTIQVSEFPKSHNLSEEAPLAYSDANQGILPERPMQQHPTQTRPRKAGWVSRKMGCLRKGRKIFRSV